MSGTKVDQKGLHIGAIVTTGTAPNYLVTIPREDLSSLVDQKLFLKIHQTASTAVTINVNGLGAKALKDSSGVAVTSLTAGQYIDVTYDGTDFVFIKVSGPSGSISGSLISTQAFSTIPTGGNVTIGSIPVGTKFITITKIGDTYSGPYNTIPLYFGAFSYSSATSSSGICSWSISGSNVVLNSGSSGGVTVQGSINYFS